MAGQGSQGAGVIAALKLWWRADPLSAFSWLVGAAVVLGLAITVGRGWLDDHNALADERVAHQKTINERDLAQRNERHLQAALDDQNQRIGAIAADCTVKAADVEPKVQTIIKSAVPPAAASKDADSMNLYLQQVRGVR